MNRLGGRIGHLKRLAWTVELDADPISRTQKIGLSLKLAMAVFRVNDVARTVEKSKRMGTLDKLGNLY